jgi:hypothetical protein
MQTSLEVEGLLVTPQSLTPAANEEFSAITKTVTGWDPFEVWRTRVREKLAAEAAQSGSPAAV